MTRINEREQSSFLGNLLGKSEKSTLKILIFFFFKGDDSGSGLSRVHEDKREHSSFLGNWKGKGSKIDF